MKTIIFSLVIILLICYAESVTKYYGQVESFKSGFNKGFSKGSPAHPATNVIPQAAVINRVIAVSRGVVEGVGQVLHDHYPRNKNKK
jgi:hypothetical protein